MRFIYMIFLSQLLFSCGVKAPPVAIQRPAEEEKKLQCSPTEADCDVTDPNYIPRLKK